MKSSQKCCKKLWRSSKILNAQQNSQKDLSRKVIVQKDFVEENLDS